MLEMPEIVAQKCEPKQKKNSVDKYRLKLTQAAINNIRIGGNKSLTLIPTADLKKTGYSSKSLSL